MNSTQRKNTNFGYATLCMNYKDVDNLIEFIKKYHNSNKHIEYMINLANISSFNCRPYINKCIKDYREHLENAKNREENRRKIEKTVRREAMKTYNSSQVVSDDIFNKNLRYLMESNLNDKAIYEKIKNTSTTDSLKTLYNIFSDLQLLKDENIGRVFKIQFDVERYFTGRHLQNGGIIYKYIYIQNNNNTYTLKIINNLINPNVGDIIINWNNKKEIYISTNTFNIEKIKEIDFNPNMNEGGKIISGGGYKKSSKFKTKEVLGKLRRVYRIPNSKKEHIKHKGKLITVSDYKILMKLNKR